MAVTVSSLVNADGTMFAEVLITGAQSSVRHVQGQASIVPILLKLYAIIKLNTEQIYVMDARKQSVTEARKDTKELPQMKRIKRFLLNPGMDLI